MLRDRLSVPEFAVGNPQSATIQSTIRYLQAQKGHWIFIDPWQIN